MSKWISILVLVSGCASFKGLYREQKLNRALFSPVGGHSYALSRDVLLAAVKEQVREDRDWHLVHDPLMGMASYLSDLKTPVEELEDGTRVTGWREYYWILPDPERPGHSYLRIQEKTEQADRIPFKEWLVMKRLDPTLAETVKAEALAKEPDLNFNPYL